MYTKIPVAIATSSAVHYRSGVSLITLVLLVHILPTSMAVPTVLIKIYRKVHREAGKYL